MPKVMDGETVAKDVQYALAGASSSQRIDVLFGPDADLALLDLDMHLEKILHG